MRLLVAGEDRVDAGKTTFSIGLLAHLAETGREPIGYKPRAGNDFWFDHDDALDALADGRLYGKDARRLAVASADDAEPEARNPVHRLWRPTPGRTGQLGEADRTFVVDRLREAEGTDSFVVNDVAREEGLIPAPVREALPLDDAHHVASVAEFNQLMAERYLPAFRRLRAQLLNRETAVVESYADVADPLAGVGGDVDTAVDADGDVDVEGNGDPVIYDAVATVAPGRVRVFGGDRYARACAVASDRPGRGQVEDRVGDVVGHVDPVAEFDLPPLTRESRSDPTAVAAAYRPAFEALVETA